MKGEKIFRGERREAEVSAGDGAGSLAGGRPAAPTTANQAPANLQHQPGGCAHLQRREARDRQGAQPRVFPSRRHID